MSLDFSLIEERPVEVFEANITHNLTKMADEAGVYKALWRPEENGFRVANDIIWILECGLSKLKANPEHFKKFDAPNGWGSYKNFVPFVERVLDACRANPDAKIHACR